MRRAVHVPIGFIFRSFEDSGGGSNDRECSHPAAVDR
jgi:hypothetical protein